VTNIFLLTLIGKLNLKNDVGRKIKSVAESIVGNIGWSVRNIGLGM
jgi:hypothetical protein